ncbi:microsomal glutathione S-transferase 1 [Leptinotarsa decemlineata]|uniref:microsomal glutathione S-transferase 1 n=1 Tax=Leptinotarsa decemlineata TaxID=7539 RepID=UPI003D3079CA
MAQGLPDAVSTDNPVFRAYLFYCGILILKMMLMTILTTLQRIKNKSFANEEDAKNFKGKVRVVENVERVRRAHLNDVENIPLFFVGAFIYTLTNPSEYVAKSLFLAYTVARIVHTFVYAVYVVPQPARMLSFAAGNFIMSYMVIKGLINFA